MSEAPQGPAFPAAPFFWGSEALGELDATNLSLSGALLPVALISTLAGARLVHYLKPQLFYPLMYGMVLIAGSKLLWDGARGLTGI